MMSNNKILTVSYGTFSCTLEGFDESFETMKAIAEYFRDLAADDRYFGAEPPQPDAEMLARIAEREIARRVEAHLSEDGIHLRAGTAIPAQVAAATQTVTEASADPAMRPAETSAIDVAEKDAPAPAADSAQDTQIDAVIPQASFSYTMFFKPGSLPATTDAVWSTETEVPSVVAEDDTDAEDAPKIAPEIAPEIADQTGDDAGDDAASFFAEGVEDTHVDIPVAEHFPTPAGRPAPNSIADKLQRIRAVVSKAHEPQATYSEDEHADPILDDEDADFSEFFSQDAGSEVAEQDLFDEQPEAAMPTDAEAGEEPSEENVGPFAHDTDAELAAALARLSEEFDAAGVAEEPEQLDEGEAEAVSSDPDSDQAEDHDDEAESAYDFSSLFVDENGDRAETADATGDEASDTDDLAMPQTPAVRARVIRVKRSDLQAALNAGGLEEAEAEADLAWDSAERADAEDGSTDEDDDFDDGVDIADTAGDDHDAEADGASPAHLLDEVSAEEDELDRLMAEADNQMDEPEGTSRRAAFDQLRGAVAATKADDRLGAEDEADADEYRTDLAAAVTPRRPVAGGRTDRPRDQRPAPLKLVAEQRIDMPSHSTGPVRPRRVATSVSAPGEDDDSFADYAAARGAHDLPELLEAAAAYLSFVEGHDQFSRPQLMTKVRQLDPDRFSREDGLRQFGMLLRSGKIEKIKGGRFTVSDDIGFRPDGERAAG